MIGKITIQLSLLLLMITVVLVAVCPSAMAQQANTAGIYGTVLDQQSAVIPGATVTAIQTETGFSRSTKTNALGQYQLQLLPVGPYRVVVEKAGFRKHEQTGLTLQVNQIAKVDVTLRVGSTTTVVSVQSGAPLVDTQNSTLTQVVNSHQVVDLPLNGRQLADLSLLSPGVVPAYHMHGADWSTYSNSGDGVKGAVGSRGFMINGARQNDNTYTLDGADNNDVMYNLGMPFPFPDAVQEFSIQTAGQGVDVGRSPGGTINIVTKSGTNQIHGDVFWFVRNTALNARNFFSPTQDQLKRNQGGFTLGGPVKKNKLFLFGGYERTWIRQQLGENLVPAIPSAHRQGDFSDLLQGPNPIQLVDPTTNQPYQNNQIPQSDWSPAFQKLMNWWPIPNASGFVVSPVSNNQDLYQVIVRGDYLLNSKNTLYARYFEQNTNHLVPLIGQNLATSKNGSQLTSYSAAIGWTLIPTANLVSESHVAMNYSPAYRTLDAPWGNIASAIGVNINPLAHEMDIGLSGASNFGIGSAGRAAAFRRGDINVSNAWHYVKGAHNISYGGEVTWERYNEYNPYHSSGVFKFDGHCTGFDQADALIGCLATFTQGIGEFEFRRYHYQSLYGGDSWRLTRHLTLNFGLRWEPYTPVTDLGKRNVQFRQDQYAAGVRSQVWKNSPPGMFYPGDKIGGYTVPLGGTSSSWDLLDPRVGFAWDISGNGRTSLRGGYGRYYSVPEAYYLNALSDQAPFGYDENFLFGSFDNPYLGRESANVFPIPSGFFGQNLVFPIPAFDYAQEPTFPQASTDAWNLTLQRQLGSTWVLQLAYVGNKATHLMGTYDINPAVYNFADTLAQNQLTVQQRRPRPEFQKLDILGSGFNSNYNALQASINKRFSRGLTLTANYTWSKALDYFSNNGSIEEMNSGIANPFNILEFYGPSEWDIRNRFVSSFVYNIPSAESFAKSSLLDAITRHWTLSSIITLQSGFPFTLTASSALTPGAGSPNANQLGPLKLSGNRSNGAKAAEWFNTSNVAQPAPGTYGTIGRNTVTGPGFANFDMAFYRTFKLPFRESTDIVFRGEAFNLFNRVNLGLPNSSVGSSTFGEISGTYGDPRILQFAVKIEF